jgi:periplasmic protein TonB
MTALALSWLEDENPRDLRRWAFAAVTVVAIHAAAIGGYVAYTSWTEQVPVGDDWHVDFDLPPSDSDVDQPEIAPQPEAAEQKPVEQPPPPDTSQISALPEQPVQEEQKPPAPPPQPARVKGGSQNTVAPTWETNLIKHLQQYKRYPGGAESRGEEGIVTLNFSVDRNGHVLAHQIVRSSGYPELDAEVLSMIERAQPLPPFPPSMQQEKLDLTVPIRFSLR